MEKAGFLDWLRLSPCGSAEANLFASALTRCVACHTPVISTSSMTGAYNDVKIIVACAILNAQSLIYQTGLQTDKEII
ncbi:MAG: hypothetical protein LBQ64_04145 [Bacteroidales bacterium]|jgi:hypothetical protein|nr:hypothetical protein [Bacteroidales bacterium]